MTLEKKAYKLKLNFFFLLAKLSALNKENIDLKSKFQLLDNEYSNELAKFRASLDEKVKIHIFNKDYL